MAVLLKSLRSQRETSKVDSSAFSSGSARRGKKSMSERDSTASTLTAKEARSPFES